MSKNELRLSQLVGQFGPGAMVDLPDRSVLIGGLDRWDSREGGWHTIHEPRLAQKLQRLLVERGEITPDLLLSLRTPPLPPKTPGPPPGVAATIFPALFVSDEVEPFTSDKRATRGRQLIHWRDLDVVGGRRAFMNPRTGKKVKVTPIRFVGACPSGHIQDLNWRAIVHADGARCGRALWLEEQGTSGDSQDVTVACECGRSISLKEARAPNRLGSCRGHSPWLGPEEAVCAEGHPLSLLIRTATNTYFPQVATVISLPEADDKLGRLVQDNMEFLAKMTSVAQLGVLRFVDKFAEAFKGYSDEAVFAALEQAREGATIDGLAPIKVAEFDRFAQGDARIGVNAPGSRFYAETLARAAWDDGSAEARALTAVVAVHRLREVSALYGFTRLEPAPSQDDGELEDIRLAVRGAPLSRGTTWLPAVEQLGEGLFLHMDANAIRAWTERSAVKEAADRIRMAHEGWWRAKNHGGTPPPAPGIAYVLLHSISHALLTQISLEAGYPASSMKERIYAISGTQRGAPERTGLLIYTASTGAQGSLGGLAGLAPKIVGVLRRALESQMICSNDPVCAEHQAGNGVSERDLLGAACHGCQLVAETSCEARNLYLDRGLLVGTMAGRMDEAFFDNGSLMA